MNPGSFSTRRGRFYKERHGLKFSKKGGLLFSSGLITGNRLYQLPVV